MMYRHVAVFLCFHAHRILFATQLYKPLIIHSSLQIRILAYNDALPWHNRGKYMIAQYYS